MQQRAAAVRRSPDVLFVISDLGVGGSERQLAMLAGALAQADMSIAVYSLLDGPMRAQLERKGIEVVLAPRGIAGLSNLAAAAVDLFRFMRRRRPRIVHFFLPAAYLIGAPMAWLARVPLRIMSRRSLNTYQRRSAVRTIERILHKTMHAVLGNSRGVVAQLKQEGVVPARLGLIYNGVDAGHSALARDESRARLGLSPGALAMSIVANLIPYKGHTDLIDALARAAPLLPADWRLLVVGRDDGIGDALRVQAQRLGLKDNIMFLGARDDVPSILAASDIGLLCSHEEGFSNAILESMAEGLPMIVTRVGGNAEAVLDGETGVVVAPRNSESLAVAIARLAQDATLRARMGEAGRRRVSEQFGVERFVRSHRALYDALRAGRRPSDIPEIAVS